MDEKFYCPICGKSIRQGHQCAEKTLRGIDAANTAAINADDPLSQKIPSGFGKRGEGQRLRDGVQILRMSGDDL